MKTLILVLLVVPFAAEVVYGLTLYFEIEIPSPPRIVRAGISVAGVILLASRPLQLMSIYVFVVVCLWVLMSITWSVGSRFIDPVQELVVLFQLLYCFFLVSLLCALIKTEKSADFLTRAFIALSSAISVLIVVSFVTGIGLHTYGDYAFGTKSFFKVGNGLGFVLVAGLAVTCARLLQKGGALYLFLILFQFSAAVFLGSATGIVGAFLVAGIYFSYYVFFIPTRRSAQVLIKSLLVCLVSILLGYAGFKVYEFALQYPYLVEKAQTIIVEGPRGRLLDSAARYLPTRSVWQNVFGEGMVSFAQNFAVVDRAKDFDGQSMTLTEVDPVDLYGAYGLPFTILVYSPFLIWLAVAFRTWSLLRTVHSFSLVILILLGLTLSAITGHIIFTPTASTVMAVAAALIIYSNRNIGKVGIGYAPTT